MFSRAFRFLKERTARVGRFTREGGLTADQSLADAHGPIRCGSEAVARGLVGTPQFAPTGDFGCGGNCSAHKKRRPPHRSRLCFTAATAYSDSLYAIT